MIYSRYGFTTPRNINMYRRKKKKKKNIKEIYAEKESATEKIGIL